MPKSNKRAVGYEQTLVGLVSIFLDGMRDKLGADLYQLMHFHTGETSAHPEYNLKGKSFLEFIGLWKAKLTTINQQVLDMAPVVRALSKVGRKPPDTRPDYNNGNGYRKYAKVNGVLVELDDADVSINTVGNRFPAFPPPNNSDINNAGFCLSFLTGKDCRNGRECTYKHDRESFQKFKSAVNAFDGRQGVWAPSSERRKQLVSGLKVAPYSPPFNNTPTKIVPRPTVVGVHAVEPSPEEQENIDLGYDSEDMLEEWSSQQLGADDGEGN
jgi:hypothetical protein